MHMKKHYVQITSPNTCLAM